MIIKKAIFVNATIDKTYQTAENYPLFVKSFSRKEILLKTEEKSKVRITNKFLCIPLTWEGEGIKKKNERIDWVQTSGLLEGLRANWLFFKRDGLKTEVIIEGEYVSEGFNKIILYLIAPFLIRKALSRILQALKSESECQG